LFDAAGPVLVCTSSPDEAAAERLRARGAEVLVLPGAGGRLALPAVLSALGERGINEIHVEAGAVLNGAWLDASLADEVLLYLAPLFIGEGRPLAQLQHLLTISEAPRWRLVDSLPLGPDLRLRLRPARSQIASVEPLYTGRDAPSTAAR
jgi:diaminohydroxyphosphoribosylaminopyrimidine deaminase/5-amino-6-(5-phosphoribosylamino)uracil reductase